MSHFTEVSKKDLLELTKPQLVILAKNAGVSTTGTKEILVKRLLIVANQIENAKLQNEIKVSEWEIEKQLDNNLATAAMILRSVFGIITLPLDIVNWTVDKTTSFATWIINIANNVNMDQLGRLILAQNVYELLSKAGNDLLKALKHKDWKKVSILFDKHKFTTYDLNLIMSLLHETDKLSKPAEELLSAEGVEDWNKVEEIFKTSVFNKKETADILEVMKIILLKNKRKLNKTNSPNKNIIVRAINETVTQINNITRALKIGYNSLYFGGL